MVEKGCPALDKLHVFVTYDRGAEHDPTLKTQGKTGVDQTAS